MKARRGWKLLAGLALSAGVVWLVSPSALLAAKRPAAAPAVASPSAMSSSTGSTAVASPAAAAPTPDQVAFFENKIRPVLVEHCYKCHSASSEKLKGGLRVDGRAVLLTGGDSGAAIVPGEPDKSRLIESIRYGNEDTAMPPKGKMPDAAIKDLEKWVSMGAFWPGENTAGGAVAKTGPDYEKLIREFWSYQPIQRSAAPAVRDGNWSAAPIDRYVLAGLEAKSLTPVADADRVTLIRRVYFDLTGLPPAPEEVDAFLADQSPDAYEKLVDKLLASERFGERWGRHWLDVARYAESLTLRGFVLKDAWKYRDYVINAFNADLPYDRFMQEQVAGDLMPAASPDERRRQMTGTSFLAIGNHNLEEQDKKQLRMDVVDEQVDTLGKAFLGQTIGCARCHDHKFDPITAKDYYALAGIFRSSKTLEHSNVSKWMEVPLPEEAGREAELKQHDDAVAALQEKIKAARSVLAAATKAKDDAAPASAKPQVVKSTDLAGVVIDDEQARKVGEWKVTRFTARFIGDGYAQDLNSDKGAKTITFQPELPHAGKYEVRFAYPPGVNRATNVPVTVFSADGEVTKTVNLQEPPTIDGRFVSLGVHFFEKNGAGFVLVSNEGTNGYVTADAVQFLPADDVAAAISPAAAPATSDGGQSTPATKPTKKNRKINAGKAAAKDAAAATDADKPTDVVTAPDAIKKDADVASLTADAKKLEAQLKKLVEAGPKRQTVISIVEEKTIEDSAIHVRGSVHNLGAVAPRGFLSAVRVANPPAIPANQSGRLEVGQWLAVTDNPLPARVMANRVWHWMMSQGLVRTVDNFGTTGELPSHPELLDYLAGRFIEQGWSVKKLVREIALSRTYRLAFADSVAARAADPENRLCWRANRDRLTGDSIRDAMLTVAGRLDLTAGGSTYKPGLASDYNFKHVELRRSVYLPAFRNAINDVLEAFDAADPSMVVGVRNNSTVAPQALFMLNHAFVQEQSAAAAQRLMRDGPTDAVARAELAYRWTLGRAPTAKEKFVVVEYVTSAPPAVKDAELQAWAQVFHGLFASIDFRYVE